MKNFTLTLILSILYSVNLIGQNIGDSPQTKLGFTTKIRSEILHDSLNIFTHLPFNYKPEKEFPLVVLLDAHAAFKAFSSCTELLAYDRCIPTSIVVGIPQYKYANFDSINIDNKMATLVKFISEELLPYLQSKYKITETIIWGQGGSGLISSYMMLEYPTLFDGYISDIPDLSLISDKANSKHAFAKLKDKNVKYYLFGSKSQDIYNELFLSNLKSNAPKSLKWNYRVSNEPTKITYFITNYMHAIEMFFNGNEE
ncbi:MAG: esterase family protein [bacterium]|nr:esterase family protein [bacterium]